MFNKIILSGFAASSFFVFSCDLNLKEKAHNVDASQNILEEKSEEPISVTVFNEFPEDPITKLPLPAPKLPGPPPAMNANFWSHYPPLAPRPPLPRRESDDDGDCRCKTNCESGTAVFSGGPDDWFELETLVYPSTVLLSQNRNGGDVQGNVSLTPTGLRIGESGTYWANFTAILTNEYPDYTPLIPVFLVPNGVFDAQNSNAQIAAVGAIPPQYITTVQGSGILHHLEEGTTLSLLATNAGSPQPEEVEVISWTISINKICD